MTTSSSALTAVSPLTLSPRQATAVRAVLRRYRGKGSAYLLPCLHEVQAITGWLDADLAAQIAESLDIPAVQVHNVIEFYALFYDHPVGRTIVRVCDDLACYLAGSEAVVRACAAHLNLDPEHGGTTPDGAFTLEIHPCLGRCEQAPFLMIGDAAHGFVRPEQVPTLLGGEA